MSADKDNSPQLGQLFEQTVRLDDIDFPRTR
jgi:hypothetical protein